MVSLSEWVKALPRDPRWRGAASTYGVARMIADHADYETGENVHPSVMVLGNVLFAKWQSIQPHIKRLVEWGYLETVSERRGKSTVYRLSLPSAVPATDEPSAPADREPPELAIAEPQPAAEARPAPGAPSGTTEIAKSASAAPAAPERRPGSITRTTPEQAAIDHGLTLPAGHRWVTFRTPGGPVEVGLSPALAEQTVRTERPPLPKGHIYTPDGGIVAVRPALSDEPPL